MISRKKNKPVVQWSIAVVALLLSSCAMQPSDPPTVSESEVDSESSTTLSLPPRRDSGQRSASAVDQLLSAAASAMSSQHYDRAAALTERAIRLAAKDPRGYLSLAQIRYRQGQSDQAELLLAKARPLAGGDAAMLAAIERLSSRFSR